MAKGKRPQPASLKSKHKESEKKENFRRERQLRRPVEGIPDVKAPAD